MLKKFFGYFIVAFISLYSPNSVLAEELNLVVGKSYILDLKENIENINFDKNTINAQILYTIFGENQQIILSLKNNKDGFLQIKTTDNYYNYDIINSNISSKTLIELDIPSIENLDVDVLGVK